jgi:hypothetical protein
VLPLHPQLRHSINNAGKESTTHNKAGLLNVPRELCVLGQEAVAGMDHVHVVLDCDLDDLVASQISPNGRVLAAGADLVGLVSLLPVHAEAVLMTVDGDCVERQLVGCAEDADGNLAAVGDYRAVRQCGQLHACHWPRATYPVASSAA